MGDGTDNTVSEAATRPERVDGFTQQSPEFSG